MTGMTSTRPACSIPARWRPGRWRRSPPSQDRTAIPVLMSSRNPTQTTPASGSRSAACSTIAQRPGTTTAASEGDLGIARSIECADAETARLLAGDRQLGEDCNLARERLLLSPGTRATTGVPGPRRGHRRGPPRATRASRAPPIPGPVSSTRTPARPPSVPRSLPCKSPFRAPIAAAPPTPCGAVGWNLRRRDGLLSPGSRVPVWAEHIRVPQTRRYPLASCETRQCEESCQGRQGSSATL